ncbi:hypothetical protein EE612_011918, partial [Oryza sativa]
LFRLSHSSRESFWKLVKSAFAASRYRSLLTRVILKSPLPIHASSLAPYCSRYTLVSTRGKLAFHGKSSATYSTSLGKPLAMTHLSLRLPVARRSSRKARQ